MLSIGLAFIVLFFLRDNVQLQFYFFFTTLSTFGLFFWVYYGWKLVQLKNIKTFDQSTLQDHLNTQKRRVESQRTVLQWIMALAGVALILSFLGIYKTVLGGTALAVIFGCALWFSAELYSEWHIKEFIRKI